ncbi:MAG: CPBP family intramembrane glutamic endopeptidase [Aestuariivirga sp.]
MTVSPSAAKAGSPGIFFALVFALSVPFWLVGAFVGKALPLNLPIGALMTFNPLIAAALLVYQRGGIAGVTALLHKSVDPRSIDVRWLAAAVLLMPAILAAEYGILLAAGEFIPDPVFSLPAAAVLSAVFFIAALGEEAGWQGYAYPLLAERRSALGAGALLGIVWAAWHIVPFLQAGHAPSWIAWQCLTMVPARIIIVWLCNNTGRGVFIAVLFHAMMNLGEFLFPRYGSHYDPFIAFTILAAVAATIVFLWGPRTLARFRYAR